MIRVLQTHSDSFSTGVTTGFGIAMGYRYIATYEDGQKGNNVYRVPLDVAYHNFVLGIRLSFGKYNEPSIRNKTQKAPTPKSFDTINH